jgi:mRNA interferase MazF
MGRGMTRGEIWLAHVGNKKRPVLILTRPEVIDVRRYVTVAEVTMSIRHLSAEVEIDHVAVGLDRDSVVNCDGLYTIAQSSLSSRVGMLDDDAMGEVCWAVNHALGC